MTASALFDIFLVCAPGLEAVLAEEARALGFADAKAVPGGVTLAGDWQAVWRANMELRGATRVLVRIESFRAMHLAQLDKRARKVDWGAFLRPDVPVRVEASCKRSRIYHAGAAAQRVEKAISEAFGAPVAKDAEITIKVRIDDDLVTISVDTTGESLHKRGHKEAVNRAPMRETFAALLLRACGYRGSEPVLDPMCGSGTFVIEAAEIAAGLAAGRARTFAFERLAPFDAKIFVRRGDGGKEIDLRFYGSDRDSGAIAMSKANAERAGVSAITVFEHRPMSAVTAPEGPKGLVMINPPYGGRMGEKQQLRPLYAAMGETLRREFSGWRVGIVTSEPGLAKATGLAFAGEALTFDNNGLRVGLYRTGEL